MCLAVPGKLIEIFDECGIKMGRIDYAGTVNRACLEYVPEIQVGQYTVVHAGFALSVIDEEEAAERFAVWRELIEVNRQQGADIFGQPLASTGEGPENEYNQ